MVKNTTAITRESIPPMLLWKTVIDADDEGENVTALATGCGLG